MLGSGSWVLGSRSWVLVLVRVLAADSRCWLSFGHAIEPNRRTQNQNPEPRTQNPEPRTPTPKPVLMPIQSVDAPTNLPAKPTTGCARMPTRAINDSVNRTPVMRFYVTMFLAAGV